GNRATGGTRGGGGGCPRLPDPLPGHDRGMGRVWEGLAQAQDGLLARRQLNELGIGADRVRNQVAAGRWAERSSTVISTVTGELTWRQRMWLGVLHAGGPRGPDPGGGAVDLATTP